MKFAKVGIELHYDVDISHWDSKSLSFDDEQVLGSHMHCFQGESNSRDVVRDCGL